MQQNPLLAQLEGLIDPAQTSWWPLAPGWWILAALLLITLALLGLWLLRYTQRNAYKKAALKRLQAFKAQQQHTVVNINTVLKQTAISAYGRQTVSQLTGEQWLDFLATKNPKQKMIESELDQIKATLCKNLYTQSQSQTDDNLYRFAQSWIKQHQNTNQRTIKSVNTKAKTKGPEKRQEAKYA